MNDGIQTSHQRSEAQWLELQRKTRSPWPKRLNWALGKPGRVSSGYMMFCAAVWLFLGLSALLRLTPVLGSQTSGWALVFNTVGLILIPIGFLYLWGALQQRKATSTSS